MSDTSIGKEVTVAEHTRAVGKAKSLGEELAQKKSQFNAALPAHIPVERFMRVILTAIQRDPALAQADRKSLWNSAMQAAQDGLLPDGREGVLVIYNTKAKDEFGKEIWIKKVQWMIMVAGLRKKVRNSGEIRDWNAQAVHAKDQFDYELGDNPRISHKPSLDSDAGPVVAAYSIATFKTGEKSREVITRAQIDKVRAASKTPNSGPWVTWYEEMARKAVTRRHAKVLPLSTDLDDLVRRDDSLYNLEGARTQREAITGKAQSLADQLDILAGGIDDSAVALPPHDPETGEIVDTKEIEEQIRNSGGRKSPDASSGPPDGAGAKAARPATKASAPTISTEDAARNAQVAEGGEAAARGSAALEAFLGRHKGRLIALFGSKRLDAWRATAAQADAEIAKEEAGDAGDAQEQEGDN